MTVELVGVGVGPGDPDLLTVAAVRELAGAGRVFVPVADPDTEGRAEVVVRAHLTHTRIERLVFALNDSPTGPQHRRRRRWDTAAERVAAYLREEGGIAAFATLGDPAVYSTFTYLAAGVRVALPDVRVRMIPGITAMQAAASAIGMPLVEGAEPLTLLPLARGTERVDAALDTGGALVGYKGGRHIERLRRQLTEAGALDRAWCAEHLGTADAAVHPLAGIDRASYLSTVIVLPPRNGRGAQL